MVLAFVLEAAVRGVATHPALHGPQGATRTRAPAISLGVVVDREQGSGRTLLRNAGDLSVAGFARRLADSAAHEVTHEEAATFTVIDVGDLGLLLDTPAIEPSAVGALSVGAVVRRPRIVMDASGEEQLAARSVTHLALRYDARVVESSDAARYLAAVKRRLEMWDRMSADQALAHDGTR